MTPKAALGVPRNPLPSLRWGSDGVCAAPPEGYSAARLCRSGRKAALLRCSPTRQAEKPTASVRSPRPPATFGEQFWPQEATQAPRARSGGASHGHLGAHPTRASPPVVPTMSPSVAGPAPRRAQPARQLIPAPWLSGLPGTRDPDRGATAF